MKIVTIVIDEKGDANVDLDGFNGKGCDAVQEGFAKALGKSTHVEHKSEFNRPCTTTTKLTNRG